MKNINVMKNAQLSLLCTFILFKVLEHKQHFTSFFISKIQVEVHTTTIIFLCTFLKFRKHVSSPISILAFTRFFFLFDSWYWLRYRHRTNGKSLVGRRIPQSKYRKQYFEKHRGNSAIWRKQPVPCDVRL